MLRKGMVKDNEAEDILLRNKLKAKPSLYDGYKFEKGIYIISWPKPSSTSLSSLAKNNNLRGISTCVTSKRKALINRLDQKIHGMILNDGTS